MCGDDEPKDSRDLLLRLAQQVNVQARQSSLPGGMPLDSDALYDYMDVRFAEIVETAAADAVAVAPESRVDLVRGQALVLARAAGLLAGCIDEGALHAVMDALLEGYAAARNG